MQKRVKSYGVEVNNFSDAFADGRAFSALAASIDEAHDFFALERHVASSFKDDTNKVCTERLDTVFLFNEVELGIPQLLSSQYMLAPYIPDEKSVLTYVSLLYQSFGRHKIIAPDDQASRWTGAQPSAKVAVAEQGGAAQTEPVKMNDAAAEEEEEEEEAAINIDLLGNGHVKPYAHFANVFQIKLSDAKEQPICMGEHLSLEVDIDKDVPGNPTVAIEKQVLEDGTTEFRFRPSGCFPAKMRVLLQGEEVMDFGIRPEPLLGITWDEWSRSPAAMPVGGSSTLKATLFNKAEDRVLTPEEYGSIVVSSTGPDGYRVALRDVQVTESGLAVQFEPKQPGNHTLQAELQGVLAEPKNNVVEAVNCQQVFVGRGATFPLPAELQVSDTARIVVRDPTGAEHEYPLDRELDSIAANCFHFRPELVGSYSVRLVDGSTSVVPLRPFVARELPADAEMPATLTIDRIQELYFPLCSSYEIPHLTLQGPQGSTRKARVHVELRNGEKWVRVKASPDMEGDFRFLARNESGDVEVLATFLAEPAVQVAKVRKAKPKAVEVVSIVPINRGDKGIVRVYLADDEVPKLLGVCNTFKSAPVTSTTTFAELRASLLKRLASAADEKVKKRVQTLVRDLHYCIVFVDMDGEEKVAPFTDTVLDQLLKFKKLTAQRLQRESVAALRADSEASSSSSSSSSSVLSLTAQTASSRAPGDDGKGNRSKRRSVRPTSKLLADFKFSDLLSSSSDVPSLSGSSASSSSALLGGRTALQQAREETRLHSLKALHKIDSAAGWNKQAGSLKLAVKVHSGENLANIMGVGDLYVEVQMGEMHQRTEAWNTSERGEPEWEQNLSFLLPPRGHKNTLTVAVKHTLAEKDSTPLGVLDIPLAYLQPDMAKKAYYLLRKPGTVASLSKRRLLITLENHVMELEPDTRMFLKPAPRLFLEISVSYPKLQCRMGEFLLIMATVRDEKKQFCLTDDLRGGTLEIHISPAEEAGLIVLPCPESNVEIGKFVWQFSPPRPGKYAAVIKYSGTAMQRKAAKLEVKPASKGKVAIK